MAEEIRNLLKRTQTLHDAFFSLIQEDKVMVLYNAWLASFNSLCVLPSADKDNAISYSRRPDDDDARRVRTNFGRLVRRQWKIGPEIISDAWLASLSTRITGYIEPAEIEILSGADIVDAYAGDVIGSCMSGNPEYVNFYGQNLAHVALLAHRNENSNVDARALLWTDNNGQKFLDREYGAVLLCEKIRQKAREIGATLRSCEPGRRSGLWEREIEISGLNLPQNNLMPYMDTMKYGKIRSNKLTLSTRPSEFQFTDTGGGWLDTCGDCGEWYYGDGENDEHCGGITCEDCGNSIDEDNSRTVYTRPRARGDCRTVCESCMENYAYCEDCGEYIATDEMRYCDDTEDYRCTEHSYACADCGHVYAEQCLDDFDHCPDCAISCANCGNAFEDNDSLDEFGTCKDCMAFCYNCAEPIDHGRLCYKCREAEKNQLKIPFAELEAVNA